jgi:ATP-binding cassette subfamily F protein uup
MPVSELSGGEQARVLIARLMQRPSDVLILDEPTNDLDIPTLDVLETSLETFPGALLLVTHDRYLLDRASTELLSLDGKGGAHAYADLAQWERARVANTRAEAAEKKAANKAASDGSSSSSKKKLSWKDQKELEGMELAIGQAEGRVATLQEQLGNADVIADHVKMHAVCDQLGQAQNEVERLYARWTHLESMAK